MPTVGVGITPMLSDKRFQARRTERKCSAGACSPSSPRQGTSPCTTDPATNAFARCPGATPICAGQTLPGQYWGQPRLLRKVTGVTLIHACPFSPGPPTNPLSLPSGHISLPFRSYLFTLRLIVVYFFYRILTAIYGKVTQCCVQLTGIVLTSPAPRDG